ncbi:MAG: TA system antitoxin ParD family protein, partial [Planctomycetia bacterium]
AATRWGADSLCLRSGLPDRGRCIPQCDNSFQCFDRPVAKCYHCSMSQPVKLSDDLVLEARTVGAVARRSIAGQVEFWARLGKSIEPVLRGDRALALQQSGVARSLAESIESVDTDAGRDRVRTYLDSRPFPHFEPCPEEAGMLVRIDADGTRTRGRFVNRVFVEAQ